jgi:hypothetical protein
MAMDLIGLSPTEIEGRHFRRNIVCWHYMWDAISELYPEIAKEVEYAYSNDEDGLNENKCKELAEFIALELDGSIDDLREYVYNNLVLKGISVPDVTDFNDFRVFLESCGGFKIC